jgi:hypothetical protein
MDYAPTGLKYELVVPLNSIQATIHTVGSPM